MASNNKLLGSNWPEKEAETVKEVQQRAPAWRYHKDCPAGKVVKTDVELDKLDAEGWVDHPGKVRLLIGHEDLFVEKDISKVDISVLDEEFKWSFAEEAKTKPKRKKK